MLINISVRVRTLKTQHLFLKKLGRLYVCFCVMYIYTDMSK